MLNTTLYPVCSLDVFFECNFYHTGHIEWKDPKTKKQGLLMWRTPEEWGKLIYSWVGTVEVSCWRGVGEVRGLNGEVEVPCYTGVLVSGGLMLYRCTW